MGGVDELPDPKLTRGMAAGNDIRLGRNDSLDGKLVYDGGLRVQGTLRGEASVTGDITVERGAVIEARLEGADVSVRGRVQGDVVARGRLSLAGGAALSGDVAVSRIVIEDGATLNGRVTMPTLAEGETATAEVGQGVIEQSDGAGEA